MDQVRIELTTLSVQRRIAKPWYMLAQIKEINFAHVPDLLCYSFRRFYVPRQVFISLLSLEDSNLHALSQSQMNCHYSKGQNNETISPGFTYGLFPITCCRAQQSRNLNRVYQAVSYLPIVIATHLEVSSPFRETLSPSVSFI